VSEGGREEDDDEVRDRRRKEIDGRRSWWQGRKGAHFYSGVWGG